MRVPLPIETERLTIREFQPEADAEAMLAVYGDPEVMRFIPGGAFRGIETMKARLKTYARESERRGFSSWAVVERESGRGHRRRGLRALRADAGTSSSATRSARAYWGHGYATEAAAACLARGPRRTSAPRGSSRSRTKKTWPRSASPSGIGMTRIETIEAHYRPHVLFEAGQVRNALVTGVSRRAGIGYAIARRLLDAGAPSSSTAGRSTTAARNGAASPRGRRRSPPSSACRSWRPTSPIRDAPARVVAGRARRARPARHPRRQPRAQRARPARRPHRRAHRRLPPRERPRVAPARQGVRGAVHAANSGRVILMTSGQHLGPMSREVAYAVSKGAIQQATMTLAEELAPRGITVNTVNPGPTDTGWGLADWDHTEAMPFGPLGRARRRRAPDRVALQRRRRAGSPARRSTRKADSSAGASRDARGNRRRRT